jgi:formylglycine-generating enzyme required for sulfatase activity
MAQKAWFVYGVLLLAGLLALGGCQHGTQKAPAPAFAAKTEIVALPGDVPLEMAWIPEGTFLMGQREGEQNAYPNKETPQHAVALSR